MRDVVVARTGRRVVFALLAAVLLLVSACASSATRSGRTSDPTPTFASSSVSPYTTGTKKDVAYGSNKAQKMDICYPPTRSANHGAILFIHGGGWSSGDKSDFESLCGVVARLGYVGATMNYRMFDQGATYVDMLGDVDLALVALGDTAQLDGWPISKVALMGASAGAYLSLMYGYTRHSSIPVEFVVGMSTPSDFLDPSFLAHATKDQYTQLSDLIGVDVTADNLDQRRGALEAASPVYRVSSTSPPTILAHGEKDTIVPYTNAVLMAQALKNAGVEYRLLSYPHSDHNLGDDPSVSETFLSVLLDYANRYLA